jgi:pyridinium-3,5-bisthiocarboxylic acid mononucleotide nickel chelatase
MSARRFAVIDPSAGVSGDMLLGALVDLGAPREWLEALPGRLGVADAAVTVTEVTRCGVRALKVDVRVGGAIEGPGDVSDVAPTEGGRTHQHDHHHGHAAEGHAAPHTHGHGGLHHDHAHHGPHRHVGELLALIDRAPLSEWVRTRARRAFELLAEAEGRVHGVPAAEVVLHEVGALDAVIDVVGVVEGFERLGVDRIHTRPVALGSGWVRAAHGVLPVPAPATALLIEGLAIGPDGPVQGEATTPTGAVLLRVLTEGGPPGRWRAVRWGWGAGGRDPGGYPNALKVALAEPAEAGGGDEDVVVLASDLDDLSPEYLEPLREALTAAGALDVQVWSSQMKKGRVGFRVEALASPEAVGAVTEAWFRHSSTAGVRWWPVRRTVLRRDEWELDAGPGGRVRVKTLHGPAGPRVKPEYDDVIAAARRSGEPAHELSRRLQEEALRRVRPGRGVAAGADNAHQEE